MTAILAQAVVSAASTASLTIERDRMGFITASQRDARHG
jgi:hypothetical protein